MKKVLWVLLALLIVIAILIWRVVANLDTLVAGLIEGAGSNALGTEVVVNGVELNLGEGRATIAGMTIANPEGWTAAHAFELDRISIALDLQSVNAAVLVIKDVDIDTSRVTYELRADGSNNLQELLEGMKTPEQAEQDPAPAESDLLLRIDQLAFEGLEMSVTAESPDPEGGVTEQQLTLPALNMTNVGGTQGAPPGAIASAVASEMVSEMLEAAAREGVNRLIEREKEKLGEKISDKLGELIDRN